MKIQDILPSEWGEWEKPKQFEADLPTLKLKKRTEICECGDTVCNRKINLTYIQLEKYSSKKFCSQICSNCNKWYNPISKCWEAVNVTHYVQRKAIIKEYLKKKAK